MSDNPAFYLAATSQIIEWMREMKSNLAISPLPALLPATKGIVVAPSPIRYSTRSRRWIQYKPVPNDTDAVEWFLKCNVLSKYNNYVSMFWKVRKPLIRHQVVLEFRFEGCKANVFFWIARGAKYPAKIHDNYDCVNDGWHVYGMVQVAFGRRPSRNAAYELVPVVFDISDSSSYDYAAIKCFRMTSKLMSPESSATISRAINSWLPLVMRSDGTMFEPGYNIMNWQAS